MRYSDMMEEELKNRVAQDFFTDFDCNEIIKNIDFSVKIKQNILIEEKYFLWAEAKSSPTDIIEMLTQLILTIGKAKTFDILIPPPFLGCFDNRKIAFVPFYEVLEIFYLNDFNWNVMPSDTSTKEFKLVRERLEMLLTPQLPTPNSQLPTTLCIFDLEKDEADLREFIKDNFIIGKIETGKIQITKNNFKWIYDKWIRDVKPSIHLIFSWDEFKNQGIIDADFYLADLMSIENKTLSDKLFVLLDERKYVLEREIKIDGRQTYSVVDFNDGQKAHTLFWNKYERPPREEYRDYILERRDLLVSQDIRERKGSFFTPQIWVELSQEYLAKTFGEDWQENYYIWDCAAGTGNLLAGLSEKYRIWASTLDRADVAVMHERIENGANLVKEQCFQFDFLNDDFSKLPARLQEIIKNTPEKLIIYINPPYAEATSSFTRSGNKRHKAKVSNSKVYNKYINTVGTAVREIYIQFFIRIYTDLSFCKLCSFSKLKYITSKNFTKFRELFKAKYLNGFVVLSSTFDNVSGKFPIGFLIWDLSEKEKIESVVTDVYKNSKIIDSQKRFAIYPEKSLIINWLQQYHDKKGERIGYLRMAGTDMQCNINIYITSKLSKNDIKYTLYTIITKNNLLKIGIYNTIRHIIPNTWLNDRDHFLFPNDGWKSDILFQTDCLCYSLFHNSNNIKSQHGTNHWIPFPENEVDARTEYSSHFLLDFIKGKIKPETNGTLFFNIQDSIESSQNNPLPFSDRAKEVFNAARELWKYYHSCPPPCPPHKCGGYDVNASFYDIREYFQGRDDNGRMNSDSDDERYNLLLGNLRLEMQYLAKQIEVKVYKYGFLG